MDRRRRTPDSRSHANPEARPRIRRRTSAPTFSEPASPSPPPPEQKLDAPVASVNSERRFIWLMLALVLLVGAFGIALYRGVDRQLAVAALIGALAIWSIVLLWKVPHWQADSRRGTLSEKELFDIENSARSTLGSLLGSATLLAGIFFAWQQLGSTSQSFHLSEQGQITDRFNQAVDKLGSDDLMIRLGGIYELERIARDSERDAGPVMDVLAAYVRHWAPLPVAGATPPAIGAGVPALPFDVQAVLEVIGRRASLTNSGRCIDLSHTRLVGASLHDANLAQLCLSGVDLRGATLIGVDLDGADLTGARLTDANLANASLRGTTLTGADLSRANLGGVDLTGARLDNASLVGTILQGAMLQDAILNGASLQGAYLFDAVLDGADLLDADLTGALLTGADLSGARSLTQDQIDAAIGINDKTRLPDGIVGPGAATPVGAG